METTYDVRIYKTDVYNGARTTTYYVRWSVAGKRWKDPYKTAALADSFRSELVSAAKRGDAFYIETGRPVSMSRAQNEMSWYDFACAFVDMKWPRVAATHAEAMTAFTASMYATRRGMPDEKVLRSALCRWTFNTARRDDTNMPADIRDALRWAERNTRPVASLAKPRSTSPPP